MSNLPLNNPLATSCVVRLSIDTELNEQSPTFKYFIEDGIDGRDEMNAESEQSKYANVEGNDVVHELIVSLLLNDMEINVLGNVDGGAVITVLSANKTCNPDGRGSGSSASNVLFEQLIYIIDEGSDGNLRRLLLETSRYATEVNVSGAILYNEQFGADIVMREFGIPPISVKFKFCPANSLVKAGRVHAYLVWERFLLDMFNSVTVSATAAISASVPNVITPLEV